MNDIVDKRSSFRNQMAKQFADAMLTLVRERDPYTAEHCLKVAKLSYLIAKKSGCGLDQIRGLYIAGMLHDIGKTSVPSEILSKTGTLTLGEWEIIKSHPVTGYIITNKIDFKWPVSAIILQHHERIDGSGYPKGLKNNEIRLESRILSVADVIDAMMTHRPYRPALMKSTVIGELINNKGIKYDSCITEIAIDIITKYSIDDIKNIKVDDIF